MIWIIVAAVSAVCSLVAWCALRLAGEADDRMARRIFLEKLVGR